jgi:hypothetical protein
VGYFVGPFFCPCCAVFNGLRDSHTASFIYVIIGEEDYPEVSGTLPLVLGGDVQKMSPLKTFCSSGTSFAVIGRLRFMAILFSSLEDGGNDFVACRTSLGVNLVAVGFSIVGC